MEWILGRRNAGKSSNAPCFLSGDKLYVVDSGSDSFVAAVARDYFHLETEELGEFWVREIYNPRQPSAEIKEGFAMQVIVTDAGRVISGLLQEETGSHVTLLQVDGKIISVKKSEIDVRRSARVSAMPSFARLLSPTQVADITRWLIDRE